jgi:hypothetical protein
MKYSHSREQGFIMTIITIVIAMVLLKVVWHIDIIEYVKTSTLKQFFNDLSQVAHDTWNAIKAMLTSTSSTT